MKKSSRKPRILVVTPEVTSLPADMGTTAHELCAKAGGLADVSAALIQSLFDQGADVHVAIPDYRSIFNKDSGHDLIKELNTIEKNVAEEKIHFASDPVFFHLDRVYSSYETKNKTLAVIFQREVINTIIPRVKPDLIHCHDWMTGLIPAFARKRNIPCLFTIHNIHSGRFSLSRIKGMGVDTAAFKKHLVFVPESKRKGVKKSDPSIDFLASGISGAHCVNTVSPTFLKEVIKGRHDVVSPLIRTGLRKKNKKGYAQAILNAPDSTYHPSKDPALPMKYNAEDYVNGKKAGKRFVQKKLGLMQDDNAPLFFWPSRLDTLQKGCRLLEEILHDTLHHYRKQKMEVVFIADGVYRKYFMDIIHRFSLYNRVAICDFDETLSRLAFAASDFVLMPSRFEPCGLPQMIGPIYGALPIAHDTGGIHDTIRQINIKKNTGNGFLFKKHSARHFSRAIHDAMVFYSLPQEIKYTQIRRIMKQSTKDFDHGATAKKYIGLYEEMLQQPVAGPL